MKFGNGLRCAFFLAGSLVAGSTRAQPDKPDGLNRVFAPAPEMVAACNGRAAGDSCTVAFSDHTVEGTCRADPTDPQRYGSLLCIVVHQM